MRDQAERLRTLVQRQRMVDKTLNLQNRVNKPQKQARLISVTSGKGGVGKTTLTVNLALAAQLAGLSTIIFDADLGLANVDIALGLLPRYNLLHVVKGEKALSEIVCHGPHGLRVIAGGSGLPELANLTQQQLEQLLMGLEELDASADLILLDTGAGLSHSVLSFLYASQEIIVITTPEPTSITDAYAVIKLLSQQGGQKLQVVVNRARGHDEAQFVYRKIVKTAQHFLGITPALAGWLPEDSLVTQSIIRQEPLVLSNMESRAARAIRQLAKELFVVNETKSQAPASGLHSFFIRLISSMKR